MNYTRFLNRLSLARKPSPIRILTAILNESSAEMISMAGGMPNTQTFPIMEASFKLRDGTVLELDQKIMNKGLQYAPTPGLPDLVTWIEGLQSRVHNPPTYNDKSHPGKMECLVTCGSQDGLCKAFEALVSEGDNVLLEHPTYSGTLAIVGPMAANLIPVNSDSQGLDPSHLRKTLSRWSPSDFSRSGSGAPKILYCIPNGGNPTGTSLNLERKKEIYKIAQEYDLLILEDDPYFYIQFTKPYIPSLLSMDVDGRVLRFDSMSKLLSSGVKCGKEIVSWMRIGVLTGPKPIVDRVNLHMQCSVMHASGLSKVFLIKLFEHWGHDGFLEHAEKTATFYETKRDLCLKSAEKHLKGLAEWSVPTGGMFLWLKLNVKDTKKMIEVKARANNVLFVPGSAFMIDQSQPCSHIRASYSTATSEEMDLAFKRLADLIREEVKESD
ncbi:kynurenine/alpha-aminoadipate aminotransferase, mitochondrial-like isoform X1 [Mytilus galloprovincialis]|uniref:kynurenine/alpha-aminoadipate aminotransferase, mitochondrial-like isoform X1 n=1 Tax=Mytilus galloprovincialis TaxID=29158 RepID=UPI003F7C6872